ncbi:hypothetical protein HY630_00540 [Candidatus Uhrbacteria bacterium]|nr:hypothetical protein [Candidatus Uhrbacteria bacterium]
MTTRSPCVHVSVEVLVLGPSTSSRVVRVSEPQGELTMCTVADLGESADPLTIRELISGSQLAVSSDGLCSASVRTSQGAEVVVHSVVGVMEPRFRRTSPYEGTRILSLDGHSAFVWGKVDGHPVGLWRLDGIGGTFVAELDKLMRPRSAHGELVCGVNQDGHHCLTPWGELWPAHERALIVPHQDGLCIVEEIKGVPYAYDLRADGEIAPFHALTLQDAERPVGVVNWQGRLMLAVARGSQSWLVELNRRVQGEQPLRIRVDGTLHGVWASPGGKTLAMLVQPRGPWKDIRRLQLSDGRVVFEGAYQMDVSSLCWSPNQTELAVKITQRDGFARGFRERIVGTSVDRPIASGLSVREMLVDDHGRLAALIQHDGLYDQPIIGGRAGTQVPLAWNLHNTLQGGIRWTTIHDDRILTWTQSPPTIRVAGHTMR